MSKNFNLTIRTLKVSQTVGVTSQINDLISQNHVIDGLCQLFVKHTTCFLTTGEMGEGTDQDFLEVAQKIIPRISFRHAHDPSHAWSHMVSSLIGASLTVPVKGGKLDLGTWQSVILVELDGPRQRNITVTFIKD